MTFPWIILVFFLSPVLFFLFWIGAFVFRIVGTFIAFFLFLIFLLLICLPALLVFALFKLLSLFISRFGWLGVIVVLSLFLLIERLIN